MKTFRSFLACLCLLMMALLPRLHLLAHAEVSSSTAEHACSEHHHHPADAPAEESGPHHDHEDCRLCDWMTVFAEVPAAWALAEPVALQWLEPDGPADLHQYTFLPFTPARAPPMSIT